MNEFFIFIVDYFSFFWRLVIFSFEGDWWCVVQLIIHICIIWFVLWVIFAIIRGVLRYFFTETTKQIAPAIFLSVKHSPQTFVNDTQYVFNGHFMWPYEYLRVVPERFRTYFEIEGEKKSFSGKDIYLYFKKEKNPSYRVIEIKKVLFGCCYDVSYEVQYDLKEGE